MTGERYAGPNLKTLKPSDASAIHRALLIYVIALESEDY
jgi:hypothetical protein